MHWLLQEKFLETIKKALKTPKTAEMAAICYVDICKASTFVSKQDVSALRYLVPGIGTNLILCCKSNFINQNV